MLRRNNGEMTMKLSGIEGIIYKTIPGAIILFLLPLKIFSQTVTLPEDPIKGRIIFEKKGCMICHSVYGIGGKGGPDLGEKRYYGSFLELAGILWNHSPEMTEKMKNVSISRPTFDREEMAYLIAYLYYLRYLGDPGDVKKGEDLFTEKGCSSCHKVGGKGGDIGPNLDNLKRYASPLYMAQAMWNHGPEMEEMMNSLGMKKPTFSGKEIVDLSAFIRKVSTDAPRELIYMSPGNPTRGEEIFREKNCSSCHSTRAEKISYGPNLGKVELNKSVTEIAGMMWNHGSAMEAYMEKKGVTWPKFSGSEMADLIAYLYFITYTDEEGNAGSGEAVFVEKGCSNCHSAGEGKPVEKMGPDLSRSRALLSPIDMAQIMWNHAPMMERKISEKHLSWPEFKGREMVDLFTFLRSITKKN